MFLCSCERMSLKLKRPFRIPDGQLRQNIKSTVNDKVTYMKHNSIKWRRKGEPDCGSWDGEVSGSIAESLLGL